MDRRWDALGGRFLAFPFACLLVLGCASPVIPTSPAPRASETVNPSGDPGGVDGPVPLEVVESGFTAFGDGGNDVASFAIVLVNPNEAWTAYRMEVHVDFFDAADAFIAGEEMFLLLLPGQTSAIAGEAFGAGRATRMAVGLPDDTTAFRPGDGDPGAEAFVLEDVATTRRDDLNVTDGRLVSRSDRAHRLVQVMAVYRDGAGAIVGGASGGIESIAAGATAAFEIIDSGTFEDLAATDVQWQLSILPR
jgi:hypothetical protein